MDSNLEKDSLWRSQLQSFCRYDGCRKKFTTTNIGKKCAGCKLVYYCDVNCQKQAWAEHMSQCKRIKKDRRAATLETPPSERQPNIGQDLAHFLSSIGHLIITASRTALLLGRPGSLASTHFFHLIYNYSPPPATRRTLSEKPLGDEHTFFKLAQFGVRPDSELNSSEGWGMTLVEKKKYTDVNKMGADESVFLAVVSARLVKEDGSTALLPNGKVPVFIQPAIMSAPHVDIENLAWTDRQLNPTYDLLFRIFTDRPAPKNRDEEEYQRADAFNFDLAMSESLETLYSLPAGYQHEIGWEAVQRDIRRVKELRSRQPLS